MPAVIKRVVVWTDIARNDLDNIIEYIHAENPKAAQVTMKRLHKHATTLESHAQRGRIVPELREVGLVHYRELIDRPWRIIYRLDGDHVWVTALFDGRRDVQTALFERLIRP